MCGIFTYQGQKVIPGQINPVITQDFNKSVDLRWGISGFLINSRLESLKSKSIYKNLNPCLITVDGYYEGGHYFDLPFNQLNYFAGLHDPSAFTIITIPANEIVLPYHPRMPSVLNGTAASDWLKTGDLSLLS